MSNGSQIVESKKSKNKCKHPAENRVNISEGLQNCTACGKEARLRVFLQIEKGRKNQKILQASY